MTHSNTTNGVNFGVYFVGTCPVNSRFKPFLIPESFSTSFPKAIYMEKKEFKITIDAPREKVWSILWNDDTYREWTSVFSQGSHAETDWQQGSKVLFLDGKNDGMVSKIAQNRPNEYMSIEHLGEVHNGVEDLESPKVREWAGAHENYTLKTVGNKTELVVDMDINQEFLDYFENIFPQALEKVKSIAEKN